MVYTPAYNQILQLKAPRGSHHEHKDEKKLAFAFEDKVGH